MRQQRVIIFSASILAALIIGSQSARLVEPIYDSEREVEHTEDTPKITTAPVTHIEIQTCRYCSAGEVDPVLQFIRYDVPHYEQKVIVTYKNTNHPRLAVVNGVDKVVRLFDISDLSLQNIRELCLNLGIAPETKLMRPDKLEELWAKERNWVIQERAQKSEETGSVLKHEEHDLIVDSHEPQIEVQEAQTIERKPISAKERIRVNKLHKIELDADRMIKHYQKKDEKVRSTAPVGEANNSAEDADYITDL